MDPRATGFVNARNIERMLKELTPPLGVKGLAYDSGLKKEVQRIVLTSKIPCHPGGYIQFHETLHGLAARVAFVPLDPDEDDIEHRQEDMELELIKLMPSLAYRSALGPTPYDAGHFMAAMYVQSAIRGYLARHAPPKRESEKAQEVVQEVSGSRRIVNGILGFVKRFSEQLDSIGVGLSRRMGSMRAAGAGSLPDRLLTGADQGLPPELERRMQESIRRGSSFAMYGGGEASVRGAFAATIMARPSDTGGNTGPRSRRASFDPTTDTITASSRDIGGATRSTADGAPAEGAGSSGGEAKPALSRRLSKLFAAS